MALARVWIKGHLSIKRNMLKFKSNRGAPKPNQRQKRENCEKRKSCENQGVTELPSICAYKILDFKKDAQIEGSTIT